MILPTKHIKTRNSLMGLGALLLQLLKRPMPVSALWERVRNIPEIGSFERFILALDFLFLVDAIDYDGEMLRRLT